MATPLLVTMAAGAPVSAEKPGGILKMYSPDSPASMSIHEEATFVAEGPMMGVFNKLVMFGQHVKQNSLDSIVPDLATAWSWNVQIRRVQAERTYSRCAQPGLLEEGPTLSRRHRIYDHPQSLDGRIGVRRGKIRHDFFV